jgi:hypothetical protein
MNNHDDARRFNPDVYAVAIARMKSTPIELTDADLAMLEIVSPRLETEAREARKQAQLALVRLVPATPLATKSAKPAAPASRFAKYFDAYTDALFAELKPIFESYKAKIAAIENRVLELEAQAAARPVEYADR